LASGSIERRERLLVHHSTVDDDESLSLSDRRRAHDEERYGERQGHP
jgi:hypothetical protein